MTHPSSVTAEQREAALDRLADRRLELLASTEPADVVKVRLLALRDRERDLREMEARG